jgi:RNA polymerase sigma factor (sigma-70 family)
MTAPTRSPSPLLAAAPDDELVDLALNGHGDALDALLRRHQPWIYNVSLRVLQSRMDAEDATQESLLKIATRLGSFRRESAFRTWAYRLAMHHLLDRKRSGPERMVSSFHCYADYLSRAPDEEPAALAESQPDVRLLVEEARQGCLLGMLLCLDREQRLVFVLGDLLEVTDSEGAALLALSPDNFRQRLSRARHQLIEFARGNCGLLDARNPCRCARKTRAFVRDGIVDPERLLFAGAHVARMEAAASRGGGALERAVADAGLALWRDLPLVDPPDLVGRLHALLSPEGLLPAATPTFAPRT